MAEAGQKGACRKFCHCRKEEIEEVEVKRMLTKAFTSHNIAFPLRSG